MGSFWVPVVHINTGTHVMGTGLAYYCDYAIGSTMYDLNQDRGKRFSLLIIKPIRYTNFSNLFLE